MSFDIKSAVPGSRQPGLMMSVSPDRGDGSRMSYLRFEDQVDGIHVFFDDVPGTDNPAKFVETDLGALSRDTTHRIKLTLDTFDGPSNDVVKVWIDGLLVHTGTSWENYYRYDSEASAEQSPRIVKTVLFRTAGTAAPGTSGNGYLVDNLSQSSSTVIHYSCTGFAPPMDKEVVVKKKANRVLPLQMICTDSNGVLAGSGVIEPPIVQVTKTDASGTIPLLEDTSLSAGQGTDGNEFVFDGTQWNFNLQTKSFTGSDTYTITRLLVVVIYFCLHPLPPS